MTLTGFEFNDLVSIMAEGPLVGGVDALEATDRLSTEG